MRSQIKGSVTGRFSGTESVRGDAEADSTQIAGDPTSMLEVQSKAARLEPVHRRLLFAGLRGRTDKFFRVPMGIPGLFQRLLREFVSSEMISFAMSGGSGAVSVRRKIMKFRDSIVRALGHIVLLATVG
jgi:hypothetical protein